MKLGNYLKPSMVLNNCCASNAEEILKEMIQHIHMQNLVSNENHILKKLIDREKLGSTSIGHHSAVPHTKIMDLNEPLIVLAISKNGFIYHRDDKEPVHLVILILSPNKSPIIHLQILAAAASLIKKSKSFIKEILKSSNAHDVIKIINKYESENG